MAAPSIRVSGNGQYFVDQNGSPFFWLGDTAWPLFSQYSRAEAETYLARRAEQGFTVIKATLYWAGGTGYEIPENFPNYAGHYPYTDAPDQPNEAYFEHVDHLVRFAGERGLVLNMLPCWGYHVSDIKIFTVESARALGLWLGRRYKDSPNIVWSMGGDRYPLGYEDIYTAMAYGIREGSGGAHLLTYHTPGWTTTSQFFQDDHWLDFNMLQTWTQWDRIYPAVIADRLRMPHKPIIMDEGAYEEGPEYPLGPVTPLLVRKQAWWSFMAGGHHTYGHNSTWRMEPGWLEHSLNSPASPHMTLYRSIIESRRWWEMLPNQCLFASGIGTERTLNTAVRSIDTRTAMIYLSTQCHVILNVNEVYSRDIRLTWVNPQNGQTLDGGVIPTGNFNGQMFSERRRQWFRTPDFWEDSILILDAQ